MITAYDWMKPAREQNNFQKDSKGRVFKERGNDKKSLFSRKNLREKSF